MPQKKEEKMPYTGNVTPDVERLRLMSKLLNHENELTHEEHFALYKKFGAHCYSPLEGLVIAKTKGIYMWDMDGTRYTDGLSAYSTHTGGHNHPKIIKAMKKVLGKLDTTSGAFLHKEMGPFMAELATFCGKDMVWPQNGGVEAWEFAAKLAFLWGYLIKGIPDGLQQIIVMKGCFHGRTLAATSASSEKDYKKGFGKPHPGFVHVDYDDIPALKNAITPYTVGIMFEPIQGEAGIKVPHDGYLTAIRKLCDEHKILMIADEIQVGFGRTGYKFACDYENVVPDLYIVGKALGGGSLPVSAVAGNEDILGLIEPGMHGSTFAGNPLSCCAARAFLHVLEDEDLAGKARVMGEYFTNQLNDIVSPFIKEIRGRGLLIGVELNRSARPFCEKLKLMKVLLKETHGNIIRVAPAAIITEWQSNQMIKPLKQVLGE
jgi:ornithine--oxo-acid transaminase